jgi:hypothetical protein
VHGQHRVGVRAQLHVNREEFHSFSLESAGGVAVHQDGARLMEEILRALLLTGQCDGDAGDWWSEFNVGCAACTLPPIIERYVERTLRLL